MKTKLFLLVVSVFTLLHRGAFAQFQNDLDISFQGAGWYQFGSIMHTSDTITPKNDFSKNWTQNAGVVFNGIVQFDEELEGSFGIGAIKAHGPRGSLHMFRNVGYFLSTFVNMARVTYTLGGDAATSPLQLTTGLFSYKYDNNIKNLGLYLIRGSVYPGILFSEFESKEMLPIGNLLGAHMRNRFGSYTQDLLLVSEQDMRPKFDFSLIYVGEYKIGDFLELGGGVNFYHYLPVRADLTSPSEEYFTNPDAIDNNDGVPRTYQDIDRLYAIDLDTVMTPTDTTVNREWYSHKGIKLMFRFAFDPKPFIGSDIFGPNDLKLYSEMAVLGLKSYEKMYTNISERIPIMVGWNIPTFKILDELALEVEYYGSKYIPDYGKVMENSSAIPRTSEWLRTDPSSWGDTTAADPAYDVNGDDIKWSLYAGKVIAGHVKLSGQVACDHIRVMKDNPWFPTYEETLSSLKDWYWMLKLTFFF